MERRRFLAGLTATFASGFVDALTAEPQKPEAWISPEQLAWAAKLSEEQLDKLVAGNDIIDLPLKESIAQLNDKRKILPADPNNVEVLIFGLAAERLAIQIGRYQIFPGNKDTWAKRGGLAAAEVIERSQKLLENAKEKNPQLDVEEPQQKLKEAKAQTVFASAAVNQVISK